LRLLILLAPLIYVAHIAEEAPGYVRWQNSIVDRAVPDSGHFFVDNWPSMAITAIIAIIAAATLHRAALLTMLAWLSYFFFANGLFHIVATIHLHRYSPGVITAAALYLPYFFLFVRSLRTRAPVWSIAVTITLAAAPMLIQAYMIIFRGARFY
jgi:Protein of unknown function with HXXEE motif